MAMNVLSISASGLLGATNALVLAANNTVNVRSGADMPQPGKPYQGYSPVEAVASSIAGGGVAVGGRPVTPPYVPAVDSGDGSVKAMPNVDLGTQRLTMMTSELAYRASAALIRTDTEMSKKLLDAIG